MLHSKSNECILVCQHVPLPGCRLALFEVSFGNITNIRVPGTRSKNSSGYPGAKLPEICTPTSRITLHGKSCNLERKCVVFATPVSQKRRCQPISFILDSLSVQMNVPDIKFSRNTMQVARHQKNLAQPYFANWRHFLQRC